MSGAIEESPPELPGGLDPERIAVIEERLLTSPVAERLGLRLAEARPGSVTLCLPFDPVNVTVGTMVHGGVIATLADVAAVSAAVSGARMVPKTGATSNLSIGFLSPAQGVTLLAEALVLRAGARQHVVRVSIATDEGKAVAEALATVVLG